MSADIARLDLRLRRRSTIAYVAGVAAYAFLIVALYPTFRHDTGIDQLTRSNPTLSALFGASGSLTSPAGWMNANLYANFLPLFALLMTLGYGASAIGGQAEDGTLGEITSLPLTRDRVLAQKVLALAALSLPVPLACGVVTLAGRGYGLDLPVGALVQTTLLAALMAFDLGLVALAVGARTGSRGTALGVSVALAAAAYVVSSLAPAVPAVHRFRYLSPVYWSVGHDQILQGADPGGFLLSLGLAAVAVALSRRSFAGLDIP